MSFIKVAIGEGKEALDSAVEAATSRFRAVLLTSATTVVGLMPLLFESSVQAQMLKGLVISVSFGMMASTLLVLYIVPCLYGVLNDFGLTRRTADDGAH
ncbi:MAG: HAE1 family hydrophobic/amphiphilic exporter-1 [Planctomycetota bacterium]